MASQTLTSVAQGDDFPQIAELISEQNQAPERQCIHSSVGDGPEDVLQVMQLPYLYS